MRRRQVLALIGSVVAGSIPGRAQQPGHARLVGVLTGQAENDPNVRNEVQALRVALQARGWRDGDNVQIAYRFAAGNPERIRVLAAELVGLAPDVIVGHTTLVAAALRQLTGTLPIVFVSIADPVADGLVASLARPGGNMTGFTNYDFAMGGKWLEILKEIAPQTRRVVVLLNPAGGSYYAGYLAPIEAGARANSVVVTTAPVHDASQIENAIARLGRDPGGGLIVLPSTPITAHTRQIIELTARRRIPAIYPFPSFAAQGGLVAYGTTLPDLFRRAGDYVDRILKGAKPADLPVQAPTKFELTVNLRTAKALDLSVPPSLLARADEVIE